MRSVASPAASAGERSHPQSRGRARGPAPAPPEEGRGRGRDLSHRLEIQELVGRLSRSGGEIVLVGNPGHPEVLGLVGYGRGRVVIVEDEAGARALPWRRARAVSPNPPRTKACSGASWRPWSKGPGAPRPQHHLPFRPDPPAGDSGLAARVDVMFVVGGKAGSNTAKLAGIARRIRPRTYCVEDASGVRPAMLRGAGTIGVSGGASTPPEVLREVVERIKTRIEDKNPREKRVQ